MGFVVLKLNTVDKCCKLENLFSGTFMVAPQIFRQLLSKVNLYYVQRFITLITLDMCRQF